MNKYITTYFFQDSKDLGASYGNIFLPLDKRNIIYWQTVYTLFFSSIVVNKNSGVSYVLFTNVAVFPFRDSIEALGVKIYDGLSLTARNPGKWATVKFFFDVIEFIGRHDDFGDDDSFVMLDTDVVALRSAIPLFDYLHASSNAVAYAIDEFSGEIRDFHGIDVSTLEGIAFSAFGKQTTLRSFIGGEFFCFKKSQINDLNMYFSKFKSPDYSGRITTEEQILTLVNMQEPWDIFPEGIHRVWTSLRVFKIPQRELNYIFLHLPSEKETGLSKLFNSTKDVDPYGITLKYFYKLFFKCIPLRRPYYFYMSKLISKAAAYFF